MCGIAGVVGFNRASVLETVSRMTCAQAHRGPDGEGIEVVDVGELTIGLGHRRLAILDLSPAGDQPMVHPGTGNALIFNGEIYNFQELRAELSALGELFFGHSDTEVLLCALNRWGASALQKLDGMYAFAFLDVKNGSLLLARDPLGMKPLYVAQVGDEVFFASELRALLATGRVAHTLDQGAMISMLAFGSVQQPRTIVAGVEMMQAGHYRRVDVRGFKPVLREESVFWKPPSIDRSATVEEACERLRHSMREAVRTHLMADVPVGVFLSSGIDSTIMAALAAERQPNIHTFTVGMGEGEAGDERHLAEQTAMKLGTHHRSLLVAVHEAEAMVSAWLESMDQPSMDGLNVYIISAAVREAGIKVALSGLGGDELFCGYPSFVDVPRLRWLAGFASGLPSWARPLVGACAGIGRSEVAQQKFADILESDGSLLSLYLHRRRILSDRQLADLGLRPQDHGLSERCIPTELEARFDRVADDEIAALSLMESRFYMKSTLLRDSDSFAMAHGLEIRVPMLARSVAELAYSLPGAVRMPRRTEKKYLLRAAFADILPPAVSRQAKRSFFLPMSTWMRSSLRDRCEASIKSLADDGLVDKRGANAVWQQFLQEPHSPAWSRAFSLVVLGDYLSRMKL